MELLKLPFVCLAAAGMASCAIRQEGSLPNIVILLTDDQGYGDVHCYGNPAVRTPNLDRLASQGTRFTDFYAGASSSTPSRAALLTGRHALRVGLPSVVDDRSENGLAEGEYTLADILRSRGYSTAAIGKWHLGCQERHMPLKHGFDEFFGIPYSNDMWPFHPQPDHAYPDLPLYDNEKILEYNPDVNQMTTRLTERAVKFIKKNRKKPFFLYLPYTQPHVPLGVSEKFAGKSGEGLYADVLMEIDWSVGQILTALERNNLINNTLVIFSSDNGPWLSYGNHAGTTLGLREGKGTTFEGGQRVPCIMSMPGTIPSGEVSNAFFSALDIVPTVMKLTHTRSSVLKPLDGENVWPLIIGQGFEHQPFYFVRNKSVEAVREGKWKCVAPHKYRIVLESGADGKPGKQINDGGFTNLALFDMENDPYESNDQAKDYPQITYRLYNMILQYGNALSAE